ncbi:hypothetical protein EV200_11229 [Pedobacter psychrotolerans]|uniref:Uncharacterized protein n=1 Tax=Pedobacter psychrotolerans TaxID=1843235 RepID=A0A4R2H177_9SPHI|nr:hypothetical protein [Pedobacter psychrotolerans]TCO18223.1 hypothetical protein EV200_11229 [Pedobacter psychrotolerans]GGE70760.1 hypothetical protein GCM10011413_41820 [Pedobacter psychrotolerans]
MNLEQEWQNLSVEFNSKADHINIANITIDEKSHHLLQDLIFKLKWKLRWIRIIDLPVLAMAFVVKGDLKFLLLGIFIIYEISRAFSIKDFNKIKTGINYNTDLKQVLSDNLKAIKRILKVENIFGYIFIPLSGPIGLLAYRLYVYETFDMVLSLPHFFLQLILVSLMGIPLIYLAKKMNDNIFSKPLKELNKKINDLMN